MLEILKNLRWPPDEYYLSVTVFFWWWYSKRLRCIIFSHYKVFIFAELNDMVSIILYVIMSKKYWSDNNKAKENLCFSSKIHRLSISKLFAKLLQNAFLFTPEYSDDDWMKKSLCEKGFWRHFIHFMHFKFQNPV